MLQPSWDSINFVLINTGKISKDRKYLSDIKEGMTHIHIQGHLFLWLLKEILKRAPNLKVIRVIPTEFRNLRGRHCRLLIDNGITVIKGHQRLCKIWQADRKLPEKYRLKREYLKNLPAPQKKLFDELLGFELKSALITARYFCLNDEPYAPFSDIMTEFGYTSSRSCVHDIVYSVLYYLDPSFNSSRNKSVKRRATTLRVTVNRMRRQKAKKEAFDNKVHELVKSSGIRGLPENLKPSQWDLFEKVLHAHQSGRLEGVLKDKHDKALCIIRQRWGLEDGVFRTLSSLAKMYGVSKTRIGQIETHAFILLGIR